MNNIITLTAFIILVSVTNLNAQVYFSRYNYEKIYFGPKNVLNSFVGVKNYYINLLNTDIRSLEAVLSKRDSLASESKLSRKDKRILKSLYEQVESVERDIVNLNILMRKWQDYKEDVVVKLQDLCYLYKDRFYTYHKNKLEISTNAANKDIRLVEFIDVIPVKYPEPQFVKKRLDNCNGKDINDCFLYCLTDHDAYTEDFTGKQRDFF